MSANSLFLDAFKSLESAVKSHGYDSVLSFEGVLEAAEKKSGKKDENLSKIRLCRQVRNFLSHESDTFIVANKEMTDFLNDYAGKLSSIELPVKKFMEKKLILDTMKVQEALVIVSKRKYGHDLKESPVLDKTGKVVGMFSYALVGKYIAKGTMPASTKVSVVMGKAPKVLREVKEDVHMKEVDETEVYLVKDSKNNIVGWY